MRLRQFNVGCFGGGTGLPSLLGGLKNNPWLQLNAVVTMFDSGGSSGQLRDELGVLPPGDILKCALALSRNAKEARRVLLARLPMLEHARLGGHTGGNLLPEGRGMAGCTAADAVARIEEAIQRPVDVVIANMKWPSPQILGRYALEHKEPLAPGKLPDHCELVGGEFWTSDIARHDR